MCIRDSCKVEHFFRSSQILGNAFPKIPTRMHLINLLDVYFAMMKLNLPVTDHKSFQVWPKFTQNNLKSQETVKNSQQAVKNSQIRKNSLKTAQLNQNLWLSG